MAQKKRSAEGKCLENLYRAADTLSAMLALEVKELSARQKTARRDGTETSGIVKAMKEITAILKDVAAVTKTVNEQGGRGRGRRVRRGAAAEGGGRMKTGTNAAVVWRPQPRQMEFMRRPEPEALYGGRRRRKKATRW